MVIKIKESFEKTRQVKSIDKSKNYLLRGQRNARYHEKYYQIKRNLIVLLFFSKIRIDTEVKFSA